MKKSAHKANTAEQLTIKGEFACTFVHDQIGAASSISTNAQPWRAEVDAEENADGHGDKIGAGGPDLCAPNEGVLNNCSSSFVESDNCPGETATLPCDLQRIWLSATGLLTAVEGADITPELAPLLAAFTQARKNLAADIAHETRVNRVSETTQRQVNGGRVAAGEDDNLDILSLLDKQVEDDQSVMLSSAELPLLLTDPQQTLIVFILRAAFESKPETFKQLLGSAPCVVFNVSAGTDVKAVARVLPVLLYGPSASVTGLNELQPMRVKPRCYVHAIAEDIDNYNGRSFGLLNCIRANLLRAADFAVPVLVVKAADIEIPEPIAAVFSARVNLPALTSAVVDDVIAIYANAEIVKAGSSGTKSTSFRARRKTTAKTPQSANLRLSAHPSDLAAVGSFALGAMIQRGSVIADTIERIRNKLGVHAKLRIEAEQAAAAESSGGQSVLSKSKSNPEKTGNDSGGGSSGANNQSGKSIASSPAQSAADLLNVPVFSPIDLNDPAIPRLEDLAGYGPAGVWGLELAKDIDDYCAGTIGWSEIDRGLVLAGPPGVGKTIFAKSLAKSAGVSFIASSFIKWESKRGDSHGDVVKTMAEHFQAATKLAPCIMLIDEIDSIPDRERLDERSRAWWVSLINAVLEQLDGSLSREGVIVIGACNDASRLDPALVRSGRLEKIIHIPYPSAVDLARIFRFHLKDELPGFDPMTIAEGLNGFTGADVEAAVRSSRRKARREQRELTIGDLDDALFGGQIISDYQRWRTAVHEAGHAIAATALNLEPVDFISIRSRGQSGGFVRLGSGDTLQARSPNPFTRSAVLNRVAHTLAGRAAETIIFGAPDTGSGGSKSSDLAKATQLLGQTHSQHGLGRDGNLVWHPPLAQAKPWPSGIAASIALDLSEQQTRAEAIITANAALVTELAETLMQTKTMNGGVFEETFAGRVREDPNAAM